MITSRHCEERSDEAEPVLGPAFGGTRGLAMTREVILFDLITF
jgi:hypothetical protein